MILAKNIVKLREKNNLTSNEVSRKLRIKHDVYLSIENGGEYPSYYQLYKLGQIFDVSVAYLLTLNNRFEGQHLDEIKLCKEDYFYLWAYKALSLKEKLICYKSFASIFSKLKYALVRFGDSSLENIYADEIQGFISGLTDILSKKSIMGCKSSIKMVFDVAVFQKKYNYNPAIYAVMPSEATPTTPTPIISESTRLVIMRNYHKMQPAALLMMFTGIRRGELLALRWRDINLREQCIIINKVIEMDKGLPKIRFSTKTKAGVRRVEITDTLTQCLIDYISKTPGLKSEDLIFGNENGNYSSDSYWQKSWKKYMEYLNQDSLFNENFTSKQLRHYFCTLLYRAGVDVLITRDLMGHKDINTTLQIYTHLDKLYKKKDVSKVDMYLKLCQNF